MPPRKTWGVAGGIIMAAWAVRLVLLIPLHDSYYQSGLSIMHDDAAHNLVQGEGLVSHPDPWQEFADEQVRQKRLLDGEQLRQLPYDRGPSYPYAAYMPAYPVMLAATYWLTGRQWYLPIQVVQIAIDALTCGLIVWVGRVLISRRVGVVAAASYAGYLPVVRLSFVPLPDALMPFLVTAGLACWLQAVRAGAVRWWAIAAGAIFGLAVLVRPDVLLLPLTVAVVWAAAQGLQKTRTPALLSLAVCGAALAPWTVRNAVVLGAPVVTKPGVAIGLVELLGKYDPAERIPDTDLGLAQSEGYESLYYPDGLRRDRQRMGYALGIVRQRPLWYASLVIKQIPRLFFRNFFGILPGSEWSEAHRAGRSFWSYLRGEPLAALLRALRRLSGVMEWWVVIGALGGSWVLLRRHQWRTLLLVAAIPLYYVLVHVPMFTVARYFLPAIPCFLLLTAVGWMAALRIRWSA